MGMGDYLSEKAEIEYAMAERKREAWEVENYIEGEKVEMVDIYVAKGMTQEDAVGTSVVVFVRASSRALCVRTHWSILRVHRTPKKTPPSVHQYCVQVQGVVCGHDDGRRARS